MLESHVGMAVTTHPDAQFAGAIGAAPIGLPAEARMTTFLFLFHSTVGVVRMRKAMQGGGVAFEVKDIPRQPRSGCGLCILLEGTEADARGWIVPNRRRRCISRTGKHGCLATFPPCRLIAHHKTRRRNSSAGGEKNQGQRHHQRDRHRGDAVQIAEHQILIRMQILSRIRRW